jgi:hypothetical protein
LNFIIVDNFEFLHEKIVQANFQVKLINKFFIRIWIYDLWITRHQVFLGESARILGNRIERFQEGIGR